MLLMLLPLNVAVLLFIIGHPVQWQLAGEEQ